MQWITLAEEQVKMISSTLRSTENKRSRNIFYNKNYDKYIAHRVTSVWTEIEVFEREPREPDFTLMIPKLSAVSQNRIQQK